MSKTASYTLAQSQGNQPAPNLLARGTLPNVDFPPSLDMYAGDSDVVTDRGNAGAALLFRQAIARDAAGDIIPWNPNATSSVGVVHATGTLTYSGTGTAADTVTINGHVLTEVAALTTGLQFLLGASATLTGDNLVALINANTDTLGVTAVNNAGVITVTANAAGTGGNAITTTEAGSETAWGAGTLAGGTSASSKSPEAFMLGVALQDAVLNGPAVYATGGYFNHEWIIWPDQIDTLELRQQAVDRSNIQVGKVL